MAPMRRRALLAGLATAAAWPRPARAALSFLPVQIQVPPGPTASTLSISNSGNRVSLQARAFAWSQPDSARDVLTRTQDLELSPPFFPLAQGDVQVLRLIFPTGTTPDGRYFRILLDELPSPRPIGGVAMRLRISLPVFMAPGSPEAAAKLNWRVGTDGAIEARNSGDDWDEVTRLSLVLPGGGRAMPQLNAVSPYLLPGAARRWTAGFALRPGSRVTITGFTRGGNFEHALSVAA